MKKRRIPALHLSKKAIAIDLDWIISLGLFLIYIGVFFIAIRQLPVQQSVTDALLENVADGIEESANWQVQRLPLIVFSNLSGTEPIIVGFPYSWKNFSFTDNMSFDSKDSKLIFVRALNPGRNMFELVTSSENYTIPFASLDLTATGQEASVNSQRFSAKFQNSMLASVGHFDKERLSDFNISMEGLALRPETATTEANVTALSGKYKATFPQLSHTSFVVAGFSRILNYVSTDAKEPHNIVVSATLRNYTSFHINNAVSGAINSSAQTCTASIAGYVDFYDDISGVTFIVPEGTNISFCSGNSTARLSLDFAMKNETRYDILFHSGDFNSTLKYVSPHKAAFGIAENITGISKALYRKLNETDYDALKGSWSYPSSKEFAFALYDADGVLAFNYQPKAPGVTNVFAREKDVFVLDKYGLKTKHKLRIKGW
ncbi:hypothetical protein HYU16_04695 [Candidatus Woesearchaeota archaeon]|nr:hypothetical protein [Candidatus Woesearchaeota archaeon]